MRIILIEPVKGVGRPGDILSVRPGHARNFLLPQKKAKHFTLENAKELEALADELRGREIASVEAAKLLKKQIEQTQCVFEENVNDQGKLFGSITIEMIVNEGKNQNLTLDKRWINLPEHITTLGEHTVEISSHPDIVAKLSVVVKDASGEAEEPSTTSNSERDEQEAEAYNGVDSETTESEKD